MFPTPYFASKHQQPQQGVNPVVKVYVEGGGGGWVAESLKKYPKDKAPQATPALPKPPNPTPPCTFCDVVGYATNICLELPHIKSVVSDTFPNYNIPEVHVTLPEPTKENKSLCTNHPCYLCDNYGHYSHHLPCLEYFQDTLQVLCELDVTRSYSTSSLHVGSGPTTFLERRVSKPTILIPPPNVKMMDSSTPILYLSSSMGSIS